MASKILPKRSKKHPNSHWHWWQVIAAGGFGFGILGSLIGLLPPFSLPAFKIGLTLAAIAVVTGLWNWWAYTFWSRLISAGIWSLMMLGITVRAWMGVVPVVGLWLVPLLVAFFLGWALPALSPSISKFLWQEQMTPQTRIGRALLAIGLTVAPVAGTLGASIGMFGSRFDDIEGTPLFIAVLGTIGSLILPFTFSYQLWPERPWAIEKTKER